MKMSKLFESVKRINKIRILKAEPSKDADGWFFVGDEEESFKLGNGKALAGETGELLYNFMMSSDAVKDGDLLVVDAYGKTFKFYLDGGYPVQIAGAKLPELNTFDAGWQDAVDYLSDAAIAELAKHTGPGYEKS